MALTSWEFEGADWENPDVRDGRYMECLCECLKERVSHVTSTYFDTVNAFKPQSDNKGLFYHRSLLSSFDTVLWDTVPKYYKIANPAINIPSTVSCGAQYYPATGKVRVSLRDLANTAIPYEVNLELVQITLTTLWTVDSIMKAAGLDELDGQLVYSNCYNQSGVIQRWIKSRYKILKLLKLFTALTFSPCINVSRTYCRTRERQASEAYFSDNTLSSPIKAPAITGFNSMSGKDIFGVTHGGSTGIRDALDEVSEIETGGDGMLGMVCFCNYGIGASESPPVTYAEAFYNGANCSGSTSYAATNGQFDWLYSSWHEWTIQIDMYFRNSTSYDCLPPDASNVEPFPLDVPLDVIVDDDVDVSTGFIRAWRTIDTVNTFEEATITFGNDGYPPLPPAAAEDISCYNMEDGSYKTGSRYLTNRYYPWCSGNLNDGESAGWNPCILFDPWSDEIQAAVYGQKHIGTALWN